MKTKLLIAVSLLFSLTLWSCKDVILTNWEEELPTNETEIIHEGMNLKSASIEQQFALQLKNGISAGKLMVRNGHTHLFVKLIGNSNYDLEEVQLWVGTDPVNVPSNKINKPVPGKFTYKLAGRNEYLFTISQAAIEPSYTLHSEETLYFFAHAEAKNKKTGKKSSAWSKGEVYNSEAGPAITYSPFIPTGGGGCFPHTAFCGERIDGIPYFDNINKGDQDIVANNGEIIGHANIDNGDLKFYLNQDWVFLASAPEVVVTGFDEPGIDGNKIYEGELLRPEPPMYYYCGTLIHYNYYKVELKVQYCTTTN